MNELHFAFQVRQHLNRGLHELRPEVVARLANAREEAIAHQKRRECQSMLATAGSFFHLEFDALRSKRLLLSLLLLLCVAVSLCWEANRQIDEQSDIDSALLADDLPISALTDKGFGVWLDDASSK